MENDFDDFVPAEGPGVLVAASHEHMLSVDPRIDKSATGLYRLVLQDGEWWVMQGTRPEPFVLFPIDPDSALGLIEEATVRSDVARRAIHCPI